MSKYYGNHSRSGRSRREKIGFYTAFSICLIAVCMAVYSTYNTVNKSSSTKPVSFNKTDVVAVNEPVTGIHATSPVPTLGMAEINTEEFTIPTATSEPDTLPTEEDTLPSQPSLSSSTKENDALETMLSVEISLGMPTKSGIILNAYSKDPTYYKTINTWKPHTGADFSGELGEDVMAMLNGEVTKVYEDKLFGKTVEISVNNTVICYSGLGSIAVQKGDKVDRGDKIGTIGTVPLEASEDNHIHVSVKIGGAYADPLSFIDNED